MSELGREAGRKAPDIADKKELDQSIQYVNQEVVPTLQKSPAPGFKGAYWLCDRYAGKLMVFTLWESEQAMRASEEAVKQARAHLPAEAVGQMVVDYRSARSRTVEVYARAVAHQVAS